MATVAVYRDEEFGYSDAWEDDDEFREKEAVRRLSTLLGKPSENLFAGVVEPGQNVVVKPNWVLDHHPYGFDPFSIVTHSAVLRAVVDLVYEALGGTGTITIADAPQWNCDFRNLLRVTRVERISEYYRERHGFNIPVLDLRNVAAVVDAPWVKSTDREVLPGDPAGYSVVDFGDTSAFVGLPNADRIYGADYDRAETRRHHNAHKHEYLVSRTILDADTVVHVPKLKVHKKVGVTLNAKGMVGINGHKNWIAHYRVGPPSAGGDEYADGRPVALQARARVLRLVMDHLLAPGSRPREAAFEVLRRGYQPLKPLLGSFSHPDEREVAVEGGNWHGNDTAWRMTADLARAVIYADTKGNLRDSAQRRFVSVVDGIVGGEKEGPLAPSPKASGVLLAGENLLAVDVVGARLMGFDWRKIKSLRWLVDESPHDMGIGDPAKDITVVSNVHAWSRIMADEAVPDLAFLPHPGWVGHVEVDRSTMPVAG